MSTEHADTYVVTRDPVIAAEPSPSPEPVVETKPPAETTETAVETTETGEESAEQKESKPKPGSQRQKEARQRAEQAANEALQRAHYLEQQLAQLQAQINPVKPDSEPQIDDFETLDEYVSAKANFVARKQLESYQYQQLEQQARQANQTEAEQWNTKVQAAVGNDEANTEAVHEFTYFAQQVERTAPAVAQAAGQAIRESEVGPELVIALGKSPELMQKLAAMSPYKAVAELTRLEDKILASRNTTATATQEPKPEHKPTTKAPAPVAPVSSAPNSASIATKRYDTYIVS